jgi:hypothetical protein
MGLLRSAARAYLLDRLVRGSSRSRYGRYGYGRRRRSSSGLRMRGPFPTYTTRTRGGSRVSVGGCCLPIPLTFTVATAVALGRALRSG